MSEQTRTDRPTPTVGQIYRHFKGNLYEIASPPVAAKEDYLQGDPVTLFIDEEEYFGVFTSDVAAGETIVFYRKDTAVYARSLSNFLEILSSKSGDRASNYYRFTLVSDVEVLE